MLSYAHNQALANKQHDRQSLKDLQVIACDSCIVLPELFLFIGTFIRVFSLSIRFIKPIQAILGMGGYYHDSSISNGWLVFGWRFNWLKVIQKAQKKPTPLRETLNFNKQRYNDYKKDVWRS